MSVALVMRAWWKDGIARQGFRPTLRTFLREMWDFLRESTPERRRRRYGDAEYDWDYRVDTTSATVSWRDRLLGVFHSAYQATEPGPFHEMVSGLKIDYQQFVFIDLGSGKGRTLLMASNYPFRGILGVELLPALNRVAEENIRRYKSDAQKCFAIESICGDAREFVFPPQPAVVYLFNPFSEAALEHVTGNLERSLQGHPRPLYVLYYNPLLEHVFQRSKLLEKVGRTELYAVYGNTSTLSRTEWPYV